MPPAPPELATAFKKKKMKVSGPAEQDAGPAAKPLKKKKTIPRPLDALPPTPAKDSNKKKKLRADDDGDDGKKKKKPRTDDGAEKKRSQKKPRTDGGDDGGVAAALGDIKKKVLAAMIKDAEMCQVLEDAQKEFERASSQISGCLDTMCAARASNEESFSSADAALNVLLEKGAGNPVAVLTKAVGVIKKTTKKRVDSPVLQLLKTAVKSGLDLDALRQEAATKLHKKIERARARAEKKAAEKESVPQKKKKQLSEDTVESEDGDDDDSGGAVTDDDEGATATEASESDDDGGVMTGDEDE